MRKLFQRRLSFMGPQQIARIRITARSRWDDGALALPELNTSRSIQFSTYIPIRVLVSVAYIAICHALCGLSIMVIHTAIGMYIVGRISLSNTKYPGPTHQPASQSLMCKHGEYVTPAELQPTLEARIFAAEEQTARDRVSKSI